MTDGAERRERESDGPTLDDADETDDAGSPRTADPAAGDADSTTGTTENDTNVGRVAGQDEGYLETGAERRAELDEKNEGSSRG